MICSLYLNERFKAKQLFIVACVGFMVGSVISALVPNFLILLLGRLISALGAGISTPLMFNLVTEIIPRAKWGVYMEIAGLVVAMATTLEPAFGGITNFFILALDFYFCNYHCLGCFHCSYFGDWQIS